jgi:hypothetical protein
MEAKRISKCVECEHWIKPGQEIAPAADGWQHEKCVPHNDDIIGTPVPVCPKCFLMHPDVEGACDRG